MSKPIIMSVLVATFAIPIVLARDPQPKRGLRRTLKWFAGYCALYVVSILYVMSHL